MSLPSGLKKYSGGLPSGLLPYSEGQGEATSPNLLELLTNPPGQQNQQQGIAPDGNPGGHGPTPEGTGLSSFGQGFSDALASLMDPNSLAYKGLKAVTPPPINLILAIRGLIEGGNQGDPSMAPDPTVGLNAPPSIGPGISGNVGNMGQGMSGTGVPGSIGPSGQQGADDADVAQGIADGLNGAASGPGGGSGGSGGPGGPGPAPGGVGPGV